MLAEKAISLVKEVHQVIDTLPAYNNELIQDISREVVGLIQDNHRLVRESEEQNDSSFLPTVRIQHAAIQRNIRCLNAYHYNRLRRIRNMRWEFGSVLPPEVKNSFSNDEFTWFKDYNRVLATYMRSVGESGGVNLCLDNKPPKSLYIEVECLSDYGQFELSNGSIVHLKKNTRYFLPQRDCEEFIRQGIFQHILL